MDYLSFAYAFTIAAGGVFGYLKAGSTVSLTSGLLFGGFSALGAYYTSQDPSNCTFLFGVCSLLGGIMSYRAISSGKFMPAGVVASLSILMIIRLLPRIVTKFQ